VQFRVLGVVEARVDDEPIELGHARQRSVLATLLVEANHTVSADQLIDRLWGEHPPKRGRGAIYSYLSRLRTLLAGTPEVSIVRRGSGYALLIDESTVDLHRFRRLVAQARVADDSGQALHLYEQALSLWHGDAFADLDTPWLAATRMGLAAERFAAELDHADIALRLGRHTEVISGLSARASRHPLDERVAAQYMLALYRDSRQAEALHHYHHVRSRLANELGSDPGTALEAVYRQVLAADAGLDESRDDIVQTLSPVPRQLPAAPQSFTGRAKELDILTEVLALGTAAGAVAAIGGIGGIGKTCLVLQWSHEHLDGFPDGQLFVNMRGFEPAGAPTSPGTVLRAFLVGLGVDAQAVPDDVEAQAALYRSLVAGKRLLIVLDNVRDTAQITPLLAGSATCTVLITSRHQLTGLDATGARLLDLDALTVSEGRSLLATRLGDETVAAEPDAVADLVRCCAGLPLAISVVAARAAAHPTFPLATLAAELKDTTTRLDALEAGELTASLRAVFVTSYQILDDEAAILLGLLGLASGPDIGLPAAASLAAVPISRARMLLHSLEIAHLVQQHRPGRYRMHDLVRLYAIEQAGHSNDALHRLVGFYLHTAHHGDRLLYPHRPPIDLEPPALGCVPGTLADADMAMAWFDSEHACLLAAQRLAAEQEWHREVWQLAWSLSAYHRRRGRMGDDGVIWGEALTAAEELGDPGMLAQAHKRLGGILARAGEHQDALVHLRKALTYLTEVGNIAGQIDTHQALTVLWATTGEAEQALASAEDALRLACTSGNPVWKADALNAVGMCQAELDRFPEARRHCEEALQLQRAHGNGEGEAETLDSLGYLEHRGGRHTAALDHYRQALHAYEGLNFDYQKADTLARIGDTYVALGRPAEAAEAWQQASRLYDAQHRASAAGLLQQRITALSQD
jgi:DNA-binding SARP family transcriptional activator/tetratricopeptide (TPR) repeat protein